MKLYRDLLIIAIITIILVVSLHFFNRTTPDKEIQNTSTDSLSIAEPQITQKYCLNLDSFQVNYGKIKRNQHLSSILSEFNISYQLIDIIAKMYKDTFDVRKIRSGNKYAVFCSKDSANKVQYFVYEHTPVQYVLFDFTDSVKISVKEKEIIIKEKSCSGVIKSSLWNTMLKNDVTPILAIELSEVYAWTIDFFALVKGDKFNVVYQEKYADNEYAGLGKIITAVFTHNDSVYYAIPFVQDSIESFFDIQGNSLERLFLKAPLRYSRVSSGFSHSRLHPILRIRRPHHGVDYAAPIGTPVLAVGAGKVIKVAYSGGAGRMVKIRHNSVYTTAYLHLSRYGKGIKSGKYVKQGDIIGYVGSSGLSTGPHLDFRFYKHGTPVDPLKVEAPPVKPVKEENIESFMKIKDKCVQKLNKYDNKK